MSKMTRDSWYPQSHKNHMEFVKRAQAKGRLTTEEEIRRFLTSAASGEAGELMNVFKKEWRGDDLTELDFLNKVRHEIADVYIYLCHLCFHLGLDIDEEAAAKVNIVSDRLDKKP